jgi:hypothetical protein
MQIVEAGQPNELITHNGFLETADTLLFSAAADFWRTPAHSPGFSFARQLERRKLLCSAVCIQLVNA